MKKRKSTLTLVFQLHKKKNMGLKIAIVFLAQVFILSPTFGRNPPHYSWTEQQIRDVTPKNTFGNTVTLQDLRFYFRNGVFDKIPKCYENVKQEYKNVVEEYIKNLEETFSNIRKIFDSKFKTILNGAQKSVNVIIQMMKDYPDNLEKHINRQDSDALGRFIGATVFGMNYYDFEFDISMQKFLQQIHQDSRVTWYDELVLNVRNQADRKSKEVTKKLNNCLDVFLD